MTPSEPVPARQDSPPTSDNRLIDAALADLAGLEQAPVSEQLVRLSAAHEVLVEILEVSRDRAQTLIPGVRPR